MDEKLFNSFQIDDLALKNRIVMAPMTRNRADEHGVPRDIMATYYAQRASAGLIITEATRVSETANGYMFTPGIHSEAQKQGWQAVTRAVHDSGGLIFAQLWHAGRVSHPALQPGGAPPLAPSPIQAKTQVFTPKGFEPAALPRQIESGEIPQIVDDFANAARLAGQAGFDGVEIHAANGYLIEQFLKDGTNQRTDDYGGSVANRMRFALQVVAAVVEVWGPNRVGVRISPRGTFNDMRDSDPTALAAALADALNAFPLAYLHLLDPLPGHPGFTVQEEVPRTVGLVRERYKGVMVVNGGYGQEQAEKALAESEADLVAFGMPYIANPDLPERFRHGGSLMEADQATLYGGDEKGYTDYPFMA